MVQAHMTTYTLEAFVEDVKEVLARSATRTCKPRLWQRICKHGWRCQAGSKRGWAGRRTAAEANLSPVYAASGAMAGTPDDCRPCLPGEYRRAGNILYGRSFSTE